MPDSFLLYPISYWVVLLVLIGGACWCVQYFKEGVGIPMLAVLGTIAVWYAGDAYYNGYARYTQMFDADVLASAWWEVAWFLVVFLVATPFVHRWFNARWARRPSGILQLVQSGVEVPVLQRQLDQLLYLCVVAYAVIVVVAVIRLRGQIPYFFFPFLGYKAEPWGRDRIGSGFDALLTLAFYVQLMMTAAFGVVAAVSTRRLTRWLAMGLCLLSWPYFIFDRTRNTILVVVIPAILGWVFLRLRGGTWRKVLLLAAFFLVINAWMAFIIANRSSTGVVTALREDKFNLTKDSEVHHQGLNMFEELCWINTFIKDGSYVPNWGARYFAEAVNPIPRALWHGKPLIGIDYAIARGQRVRGTGGGRQAGVYATISTGMVGQGVVNFGGILGPAAAALLMSLWAAILARQDLNIWSFGRLPLYAFGLILTFNLGRDITLITLYPFVFLAAFVWWWDRRNRRHPAPAAPAAPPPRQRRPPSPNAARQRRPQRPRKFPSA
ncbi:MAG TPA: hypothetical protein VFV81_04290 [Verrucomicrobiae bacterium]|nr:hypothetical protein [Verrucomicrobiae bacterium]